MRIAAIIGALACLALVAAAPEPAASSRLPVLTGCLGNSLVRPKAVDFCGDGAFFLRQIKWATWSRSSAVGAAVAHQDDCRPDCADGTYHLYPVAVWLTRPRTCSDRRVQFTRVNYEFLARHPAGIRFGPYVVNAPLGVDTTRCP
jgi:hypothetical protein